MIYGDTAYKKNPSACYQLLVALSKGFGGRDTTRCPQDFSFFRRSSHMAWRSYLNLAA